MQKIRLVIADFDFSEPAGTACAKSSLQLN